MKKVSTFSTIAFLTLFAACGGSDKTETTTEAAPASMVEQAPAYDPHRGEGKWSTENVVIEDKINEEWAASGKSISDVKCTTCHKLTTEKLVGPGWSGVTSRRTPFWIMNFITNPDPMLDKDPEAQAMLELCLVRMPNQSLSDGEARNILEYMRKNDGVK